VAAVRLKLPWGWRRRAERRGRSKMGFGLYLIFVCFI